MPGQWLLTLTVGGGGIYADGHAAVTTRQGDLVLVRHGTPVTHAVAGAGWEYYFVRFDPWGEWEPPPVFEALADGLHRARVAGTSTRRRAHDALARIVGDIRRCAATDALAALTLTGSPDEVAAPSPENELRRRLMITALNEVLLLATHDPEDVAAVDPRIAEALDLMGVELTAQHTVESLARRVNLSASRFAHLFTEQIGLSPMRALRQIQLREASLRLRYTDEAIKAIAHHTGFTSNFDFSRQFRRRYGISPRDFRRNVRS